MTANTKLQHSSPNEREREREMRNLSTASPATRKTPCCSKVGVKRGPWTPEEDEVLANYIKREGEGQWRMLPKHAGLVRCGKSCRLRWMNYLRPSVKRGQIAPDEEDLIIRLHRLLGNRWALIAGRIPGRTDNEIKNYWNTHLSKKLIRQGIDPRTHKPLNPNPNPKPNHNPNSSRIVQSIAPDPNPCPIPYPYNHNSSRVVQSIAPNPNPCPNPNPNPKHNFSGIEQTGSAWNRFAFSKSSEHTKVSNLDDQYQKDLVADDSIENWQNCDGLMKGLQNSHGSYGNEGADIGNCNDDTFSSFLNSLLNEDDFANQQHQHQQPNSINIAPSSSTLQPVLSSTRSFNHGTAAWEAAPTSTTATTLVDEHKGLNNHMP